jgi:hypothetical protein
MFFYFTLPISFMESKTTKSNMLTIYYNNAIRRKREFLEIHHIEQSTPKSHYATGKKHNFSGNGTRYATSITSVSISIIFAIISIGLIYNPPPATATPASLNATSPIDNSLMTFNATSPPVDDNFLANNLTSTRP